MAEVKKPVQRTTSVSVVERSRDFWTKNSRAILIASGAVILLGVGWLGYKYLIQEPKENKASEALWRAQQLFEQDSIQKALKGDGQVVGAEKIASQYSGTAAGNLADYYAGAMALKAGENDKAVKHLKDFSTDAKQIQARAYKLLGDAYANLGKNSDAFSNYKKAAHEFEADQTSSSEYLFFAAYFADRVMNDKKAAIELYKEMVQKYSNTQYGADAQKYLAQTGVYNVED